MSDDPASGQGIRRVAAILQALSRAPSSGLRLVDVAAETGLNKATLHRLLASLGQVGFVEQDPETGRFHLGFELYVLGSSAISRFGLDAIARPHLARLEAKSNDTTYLSVRSGWDAVCIARLEGSYPVKVLTLNVGDRRPLGIGGGGLTLLAFLPDEEVEQALAANRERLAAYRNIDAPHLLGLIETARRQGYAFFDGLVVPEMASIGVPVRGKEGRVVAAIAISAIRDRLREERRASLVEMLKAEARALEERLAPLALPAEDLAPPAGAPGPLRP